MRWNLGVFLLVAAAASHVSAHGPQIQLTASLGGKIETRRIIGNEPYLYTDPTPTALTSIYVLPAVQVANIWQLRPNALNSYAGGVADVNGPGVAIGYGYVDAASHPFKSGTYTVSFADAFKKWDGSAFVDAGTTELRIVKNAATATSGDSAPFASLPWTINFPIPPSMSEPRNTHSGLAYRFLKDGVDTSISVDPGVYLATLTLSHGTLQESDPFYFLVSRGGSSAEIAAATSALAQAHNVAPSAIQGIPEPTTASLAVAAVAALASLRRRMAARS